MSNQWKIGNEFAPFHPSASHVEPDYRDGWNACYEAAEIERLRADAERYRWLRENLGKWRIETYQTPVQSMVELHVIGDSCFYSGESFDRIIDGLTRPAEEA